MPARKAPPADENRLEAILEQIGPEFIEHGARSIRSQDVDELLDHSAELEEIFADNGVLNRFQADTAKLLSLLEQHRAGQYPAISLWAITVITFSLAYVWKTIDIIPDSLPRIGRLDDAVVMSHCLALIRRDLHAYKIWKLANDLEDGADAR